ncbi:MAG: hypothetical protein JOZ36_04280 [Acidobacteria bacterium]|nr:hypothetical protein [Acidobacteriota bacterium]
MNLRKYSQATALPATLLLWRCLRMPQQLNEDLKSSGLYLDAHANATLVGWKQWVGNSPDVERPHIPQIDLPGSYLDSIEVGVGELRDVCLLHAGLEACCCTKNRLGQS